jgi:hypothetical protein
MCDIITKHGTTAPFCLHGNRFVCSNTERTPSPLNLCDLHTAFCSHCARPFCQVCIAEHEFKCSMRPAGSTWWDTVVKAMGEVGMT